MDNYDYIIAGAGCAGLSLLHYILKEESLIQKKILVIDKSLKKSNDRTWCFWEEGQSDFEDILTSSWNTISIHNADQNFHLATTPFSYKMIDGLSFYENIITKAKQYKNIEWKEAEIHSLENNTVYWETGSAKAHYIFSSLLPFNPVFHDSDSISKLDSIAKNYASKPFLWQHFKGVTVQFEKDLFDHTTARLMDFNVEQHDATAFMYVLPINSKKALFEYTLFSKSILNKDEYEEEINAYLQKNYPNQMYSLLHEEYGAIPMTQNSLIMNYPVGVVPIGTIGAAVKASTGYAFKFIQEQTKNIAISLSKKEMPNALIQKTRHYFYDAVLLDILYNNKMKGAEIFTRIFQKNKASTIFRFLSNTSSIFDDIKIMRTLPTRLFLWTAIRILLRRK